MALIKCGECGSEISDKAAACPKCDAPVPKAPAPKTNHSGGAAAFLAVVVGLIGAVAWFGSSDEKSSAATAAKADKVCEAGDLRCRGEKGVVAASVYCKDHIERLAKHSVKWVDRTFETKMSHYRWTSKPAGAITFVGDKAEFQNGFGAYTRVIYECDLADDLTTVTDVRVREGRLPVN